MKKESFLSWDLESYIDMLFEEEHKTLVREQIMKKLENIAEEQNIQWTLEEVVKTWKTK